MQRLKEHIFQDFIVSRVNHISLQQKLDDHEKKFQAIGLSIGGMMVCFLAMIVVVLYFVMKLELLVGHDEAYIVLMFCFFAGICG